MALQGVNPPTMSLNTQFSVVCALSYYHSKAKLGGKYRGAVVPLNSPAVSESTNNVYACTDIRKYYKHCKTSNLVPLLHFTKAATYTLTRLHPPDPLLNAYIHQLNLPLLKIFASNTPILFSKGF